jgi:essential nuclear protein 1
MPKATTPTAQRPARRHNPLEDDIVATGLLRTKPSKRKSKDSEENEEHFIDAKASKNILRIGRELAEEDNASKPVPPPVTADNFGYDSRFGEDEENEQYKTYDDDEEVWGDDDDEVEEIEVDPNDLETYRKFMPGQEQEDDLLKHGWDRKPSGEEQGESVNLADLILEKIAAHEAAEARKGNGSAPMAPVDDDYELPEKVIDVYTKYVSFIPR